MQISDTTIDGVQQAPVRALADMVYRSEAMKNVCDMMLKTRNTHVTVLIQGETGTGKELAARAIHGLSPRKNRRFFCQNAGAMQDTLIESELFGHRRGSFSGAIDHKPGIFEEAHGATVFLDEIGEASPAFQVRLLRLLESGLFRRVGETIERKVDVRIIAATNRDLKKEVEEGRFRADLYYRLNVFPIQLPPLRERQGDIEILANFFARQYSQSINQTFNGFDRETLTALKKNRWPGNIRELKNSVHRLIMGSPMELQTRDVPSKTIFSASITASALPTLEEVERSYIVHVLKLLNGNKTRTAEQLGLNRSTFRFRLKKLGISA